MRVTQLRIYPVKSLGGGLVDEALVQPWGLAGDRRWALVDDAGDILTAREVHGLLALRGAIVDDETIRITEPSGESILVDTPLGLGPVPVSLSRQGFAAPADEDVNQWLSRQVGRRVRLVWQEDPTVRSISGVRGGMPGESLSFADAGPLLLTSEASLDQLGAWMAEDVDEPDVPELDPNDLSDKAPGDHGPAQLDMLRFRPNVVIDGDVPFAEDGWATVRIGEVELRTTMVCDRCVMTTIDPVTLAGGKEPIRTLARHRRRDRSTWFGTRLVALGGGSIRVGDEIARGRAPRPDSSHPEPAARVGRPAVSPAPPVGEMRLRPLAEPGRSA